MSLASAYLYLESVTEIVANEFYFCIYGWKKINKKYKLQIFTLFGIIGCGILLSGGDDVAAAAVGLKWLKTVINISRSR